MFELDEFGFVRLGLKATATFPQINIRSDFQSGIKISDGNWHQIETQFLATKALLLIDNNVQQVVIYKNDNGKLPQSVQVLSSTYQYHPSLIKIDLVFLFCKK